MMDLVTIWYHDGGGTSNDTHNIGFCAELIIIKKNDTLLLNTHNIKLCNTMFSTNHAEYRNIYPYILIKKKASYPELWYPFNS